MTPPEQGPKALIGRRSMMLRRPEFGPKAAACAIVVAASAVVAFAVTSRGAADGRTLASSPVAPPQAVEAAARQTDLRLLRRLARLTASGSGSVTSDVIGVRRKRIAGDIWTFAATRSLGRVCWLLRVPRTTDEGSCAAAQVVKRQPMMTNLGLKPNPRDPSRIDAFVVYGLVSDRVRSARITLADCTSLSMDFRRRPLFWTSVPRDKVVRGALPTELTVRLRGGSTVRRTLMWLGPNKRPPSRSCTATALPDRS